jgi:hypothetical protein
VEEDEEGDRGISPKLLEKGTASKEFSVSDVKKKKKEKEN